MTERYVHGYTRAEARRLTDQANALADLLHAGVRYPSGAHVLEVGCGVGAQTVHLAAHHPQCQFTAIDRSAASLAVARRTLAERAIENVALVEADLFDLPPRSFDHVFVCFVLEHLIDPEAALRRLAAHLAPGGTITVIEGDHRSFLCHPASPAADHAVSCLVELQRRAGGDPHIGRRLHPLLCAAGYGDVRVEPIPVYADASRPGLVDAFTRNTFNAMVAGVERAALDDNLTTPQTWRAGMQALDRAAADGGTAFYCFFRGVAIKRDSPAAASPV